MKYSGRQSLYRSGTGELSLLVFNEYDLYQIRHTRALWRELRQRYQFTNAQAAELRADLAADKIETDRFNASQNAAPQI